MTFIEEIKKPFNFISLIIGIIGIFLSILFYLKSEKSSDISYQFEETSSLLYDSSNLTSTIIILDKDSLPIKKNVYLINGTIWNSGDYEIKKNDIRKPLNILLDKDSKIIDFKILEEKDKSISNFKLKKVSSNNLKVDWDYFDPKFGFKFQIIYEDLEPSSLTLKGKILNIEEFNNQNINSFYNKTLPDSFMRIITLLILISIAFKENVIKNFFLKLLIIISFLGLLIVNLFRLYEIIFPNIINFN